MKKLSLLPLSLSLAILFATLPDAIVLFNGTDLSQFRNARGEDAGWAVADGVMTVVPISGDIQNRQHLPHPAGGAVIHNGVLVQNQTTILGYTFRDYTGYPPGEAHGAGPIVLQDHSNPIGFRNILIHEL